MSATTILPPRRLNGPSRNGVGGLGICRFLRQSRRNRHADAEHRLMAISRSTTSATTPSPSPPAWVRWGLAWTVAGFGDFSGHAGETGDMLMRNCSRPDNSKWTPSATTPSPSPPAWVRSGWNGRWPASVTFRGNANETDMLMRNSNTGAFELYDIGNNAITFAGPDGSGRAGMVWSLASVPIDGAGTSENAHAQYQLQARLRSSTSATTSSRMQPSHGPSRQRMVGRRNRRRSAE